MSNKAADELLAAMHDALAQALLDRIRSGEATASDLNVARQFLKDNHVSADPTEGSPLGNLVADLPFPKTDFSVN